MSAGSYRTLAAAASAELIERKSRFVGQAGPAVTEEEALSFIQRARESHKGASHHCFAYVVGENAGVMRYQDDGEPQGTAGIPILETLRKNGLVNCACVVTRFFGGILLGAGGLARAYGRAAAMAVEAAGVVIAESSVRLSVRLPYARWDKVLYALERLPVRGMEQEFGADVLSRFVVREADLPVVLKELAILTEGGAQPDVSAPFYALWPDGEQAS